MGFHRSHFFPSTATSLAPPLLHEIQHRFGRDRLDEMGVESGGLRATPILVLSPSGDGRDEQIGAARRATHADIVAMNPRQDVGHVDALGVHAIVLASPRGRARRTRYRSGVSTCRA